MSLMRTRYQKITTYFALLLLFLFSQPAGADSVFSQLKTLEQAVNITLQRLESEIQLEPASTTVDIDFSQRAGQQLQMTLVGMGRESLLQEDYYNLCLYLLARKNVIMLLPLHRLNMRSAWPKYHSCDAGCSRGLR